MITIFAHRGVHQYLVENSLKSFEALKTYKSCKFNFGVELDVQMTKYGELVCYHDSDLQRVHGVPYKVWELTSEQLKYYDIATVNDLVKCFEGTDYLLDIELKFYSNDNVIAVCNKIKKKLEGRDLKFFISSFNKMALKVLSNISDFSLYLISDNLKADMFNLRLDGVILRKNLFLSQNKFRHGFYTVFGKDNSNWNDDILVVTGATANYKGNLFIITDNVDVCLELLLNF